MEFPPSFERYFVNKTGKSGVLRNHFNLKQIQNTKKCIQA